MTLLNKAEFLLGNSSSGILESSTFKTPCINIGFRQNGRIRSKNIIDVSLPTKKNLSRAYKKIQSQSFKQSIRKIENPYGNGNSSKKIVDILLRTKINDELLFKKLTY